MPTEWAVFCLKDTHTQGWERLDKKVDVGVNSLIE